MNPEPIYNSEPNTYLGLRTFDFAAKRIGKADFYIVVCHENLKPIVGMIKSAYKEKGKVVDAVFRHIGSTYGWTVHGMNNYGPPFMTGTVNSDAKDKA